jgi:hypothetical protein
VHIARLSGDASAFVRPARTQAGFLGMRAGLLARGALLPCFSGSHARLRLLHLRRRLSTSAPTSRLTCAYRSPSRWRTYTDQRACVKRTTVGALLPFLQNFVVTAVLAIAFQYNSRFTDAETTLNYQCKIYSTDTTLEADTCLAIEPEDQQYLMALTKFKVPADTEVECHFHANTDLHATIHKKWVENELASGAPQALRGAGGSAAARGPDDGRTGHDGRQDAHGEDLPGVSEPEAVPGA